MNHVQTTSFDAAGNTTSVLDNLGHGPTYAYGHGGELLTTTDSLSHTTSDQYDSRYRLIQTTAADGGVTQITLDAAGNRIKLVDPANNQTSWVVDALNRDTSETNALGTTTTTYDPSSDVTSITDADGRVRDFVYDNLHRQTAENWMSGGTVVNAIDTAYDAANEVTSIGDSFSAYALGYNGDGQVLTIDNAGTPNVPHVLLTSTLDAAGDRTSLSATINGTADFLNNYAYDADQRLTMVQQQQQTGGNGVAPKEIDLAYNALGQCTGTADYNFIGVGPRTDIASGALSYDTGNRLTGLNYTADGGATSIDAYTWGFDNGNRVTSMTSTADGSANYGYDSVNELTSATYVGTNQPANEASSYNLNGSRTMAGYSTGAANLLASDGTFNYQYDADGNRTVRTRISNAYASDYKTTDSYDYRNRLTDQEYFDNNGVLTKHVHYVYDVLDRAIGEQIDDTGGGTYDRSQWYAFDGAQPVEQFDANGNQTERNLVAPSPSGVDAVMAQEGIPTPGQSGTTNWMLPDNLGTPRDTVNNNSAVVDHIITDAYGQVASQSNPSAQPWNGFAGGHADANTGQVTNLERQYDPSTGGWTTKDPIGFLGGDANTGRYAGNSPTNATDPTGLAANPANAMFEFEEALFGTINNWLGITQEQVLAEFRALHQQDAMQAQTQAQAQVNAAVTQQAAANMMANQQAMFGEQQALMGQGAAAQQAAAQNMLMGPPNWVDTTLGHFTNFFAGYANVVTAGYYNQWIGGNAAFVDTNSGMYTTGQAAGLVWWGLMGTTLVWNAAGLPTYSVGAAPSSTQPFHVLFGTARGAGPTTWYHAVGAPGHMWVTPAGSAATGSITGSLTGIPILSPAAVGTAPGAYNCITAAAWGFIQGWWVL